MRVFVPFFRRLAIVFLAAQICFGPMHYALAQSISAPDDIYGNPDTFRTVSGVAVTTTLSEVRVTVSVDSGQIQIGSSTISALDSVQGYAEADWTSGTAMELAFSGSQTDVNAALATLQYQGTSGTLTSSVSPAGAAYYEATNNYYEYIESEVDWNVADADAISRTLNGENGYLATITSLGEMQFIVDKIGGDAPVWLGGSDADSEGDWMWTRGVDGTGTASAIQFWDGTSGGSVQNGLYAPWCPGEPNNNGGNEHYLQITFGTNDGDVEGGCWNDLRNNGSTNADYNPTGYVVEFNGTSGTSETTTILTATRPDVTSIVRANPSARSISSVDVSSCFQPQFTVTFNKAVQYVDSTDFDINGTASTGVTIDTVTGSGATRTITLDCLPSANRGTIEIGINTSQNIKDMDELGMTSTAIGSSEDYFITDAPLLNSVSRLSPANRVIRPDDVTSCLQPQFTAVFSEAVSNVDAADFNVGGIGGGGMTVSTVSSGSTSFTVTLDCIPSSNRGIIELTLDSGNNIVDASSVGLASTSIGSSEDYEVTDAPILNSITRHNPTAQEVSVSEIGTCTNLQFRATFSEAVQGVGLDDFVLSGDGAADMSIETLTAVSTSVYSLSLSCLPVTNRGSVKITLAGDAAIVDTLNVALGDMSIATNQTYLVAETRMTPSEDKTVAEVVVASAEAPAVAVEKQIEHIQQRLTEQRTAPAEASASPDSPDVPLLTPSRPPLTPTRKVEMVATRVEQLTSYFTQTQNGNIYFGTDSNGLTPAASITLGRQLQQMRRYKSAIFQIEGHTDRRGSVGYNQKLGMRRANAVRQFFIDQGIEPERVEIVSFGEERPLSNCNQESCWQLNRRAQTRLVINEALQQEIGQEIENEYDAPAVVGGQASLDSCGLIASLHLVNETGVMQDQRPVLCNATEALSDELGPRWGVWTQGLISFGVVQSDENAVEMDLTGHNLTFGIDYRFPNETVFGVAFGIGQNDLEGEDETESKTSQLVGSTYMAKPLNSDWIVNLSAGSVFSEIDSTRPDSESGDVMTGERDGLSIFGNLELVYTKLFNDRSFDLSATYTKTRTRLQAYEETGTQALAFRKQNIDSQSVAVGGVMMFKPTATKAGIWRAKLGGSLQYDLSEDSAAQINFVHVPSETDYLVISENEEPLTMSLKGGYDWTGGSGSSLQLDYNYQQNAALSRIHSFSVTYRKPF